MVNAGSVITFTVRGTTGQYSPRTVAGVRQDAINALTPFFDVTDVTIETQSFTSDPFNYISNWPYTATVRLTTRVAYAGIRDIDSVVAHAFYEAAGDLPTVTGNGYEQGQGQDTTTGISLVTLAVLGIVALIAIAVIKFE